MVERNSNEKKIRPPEEAGPATDTEQNVSGVRWGSNDGAVVADNPPFDIDSDHSMEGKRESIDIAADLEARGDTARHSRDKHKPRG